MIKNRPDLVIFFTTKIFSVSCDFAIFIFITDSNLASFNFALTEKNSCLVFDLVGVGRNSIALRILYRLSINCYITDYTRPMASLHIGYGIFVRIYFQRFGFRELH